LLAERGPPIGVGGVGNLGAASGPHDDAGDQPGAFSPRMATAFRPATRAAVMS
jgi:hypothetical protein